MSATKAADANYLSTTATAVVTVSPAPQTIAFGTAPTVVVGSAGMVSATGGNSGNTVVFTSKTPVVCGVKDSTVTGVTAGTCTIAANQAGTVNYVPAQEVTQAFAVGLATATAVHNSNASLANAGESVTFTATVTGETPTGTVAFLVDVIAIDGCGAQAMTGDGPATASCTTDQLAPGSVRSRRATAATPTTRP